MLAPLPLEMGAVIGPFRSARPDGALSLLLRLARAPEPLREQHPHAPALLPERQPGLLGQVLEHQPLVAGRFQILILERPGWIVVVPAELVLRRVLHVADHRPADVHADPADELRIRSAAAPADLRVAQLLAVDLDPVRRPA